MDFNKETGADLFLTYQGASVKVTLEFPEQPDRGAEEEFTARLKAICLEKLEDAAGQGEEALSLFFHAKDKGGWGVG